MVHQFTIASLLKNTAPSATWLYFLTQHSLQTLNPIEHVWKHLKDQVNQRPTRPQNFNALWDTLLEEWEKIDGGFINSLIESMPDHVEAVIDASGGSTKH